MDVSARDLARVNGCPHRIRDMRNEKNSSGLTVRKPFMIVVNRPQSWQSAPLQWNTFHTSRLNQTGLRKTPVVFIGTQRESILRMGHSDDFPSAEGSLISWAVQLSVHIVQVIVFN